MLRCCQKYMWNIFRNVISKFQGNFVLTQVVNTKSCCQFSHSQNSLFCWMNKTHPLRQLWQNDSYIGEGKVLELFHGLDPVPKAGLYFILLKPNIESLYEPFRKFLKGNNKWPIKAEMLFLEEMISVSWWMVLMYLYLCEMKVKSKR